MEIDFHFSVTYVVSRLAGLEHDDAQIVATCSQYVDDTVNTGVLNFKTGEAFYRISTAHEKSDYRITLPVDERKVWVPFHFLPGNNPEGPHELEYYNRIVCRPNSLIAQEMNKNCILKKNRPFGLHQLGITAHVFIDTWAHQGFAGVNHLVNVVSNIDLIDPVNKSTFWNRLSHAGLKAAFWQLIQPSVCKLIDKWFPMGHGAALHYPDHPFRVWSYTNGHGQTITRDNPKDFLEAADELCKFIQRYIQGSPTANVSGLPSQDKKIINSKIREFTDDDGEVRNENWKQEIRNGVFSFGSADPTYLSSGKDSWKFQALGTTSAKIEESDQFSFNQKFLSSNWKLFHDAAKAHQFEILTEVLPKFGICAI